MAAIAAGLIAYEVIRYRESAGTGPAGDMTDPGGGYGWRSGGHLPRRRGGVFGMGRASADVESLFGDDRPLCVLLLPAPLEVFELRERAEDLLTAPGVAAVDPPRLS